MLIASILEPTKANCGDYWYNLANKTLHEAVNIMTNSNLGAWSQVPHGVFNSSTAPRITPTSITMPIIWIGTNDPDRIPHLFDSASLAYIPIIPPGYMFPTQHPTVGNCWHDTLSGFDFIYNAGGWIMMPLAGAGAPLQLGSRCAGCFAHVPPGSPICPSCTGAQGVSPQLTSNINVANVTSGGIGHLTFTPTPGPQMILSANNSALKIYNLVEIFADGRIVYDISYTPDKAAVALWDAITQMSPIYKENVKIQTLEDMLVVLTSELKAYAAAGFKLPSPKAPADPNAAWNAAMGVII